MEIKLTNGGTALIDTIDAPLAVHPWRLGCRGYVVYSTGSKHSGNYETFYLHRVILNAPKGIQVDHRNRIRTDCQRHNLRLATNGQNQMNRTSGTHGRVKTSKYRGVAWDRFRQKWMAKAAINGRWTYLGRFGDETAAALAYNAVAAVHYGEFAELNRI